VAARSTPVTGILTATSLLERRSSVTADAEAAFLVQTIRSCGSLMLSVVSNVLDMRALDMDADPDVADTSTAGVDVCAARAVVLKPAPFSPCGLLDEVLGAVCAAMGARPLAPRVQTDGRLPPIAAADVERLTRILQNVSIALLRHATRDDAISVRLACPLIECSSNSDEKANNSDDGGGAAAELQIDLVDDARHAAREEEFERMWAPYVSSSTPIHGGLHSGLGLCAARAFARAMHGSLIAERTKPRNGEPSGIAMRLRLPVRVPPPQDDDDEPTRQQQQEGEEAPQRASGGQVPGKSDSALLRQLHRGHGRGCAAADGCLFAATRDAAVMRGAVGGAAATAHPVPEEVLPPLRVLLVEDHVLILRLVSTLLRSAGFTVTTAAHGADALAQLQAAAACGAALPDAVLCDISMPVMCGLSFARAFRAWEAARGAPRLYALRSPPTCWMSTSRRASPPVWTRIGQSRCVRKRCRSCAACCAAARRAQRTAPLVVTEDQL
jgi:CheY-like chemotaxis protein